MRLFPIIVLTVSTLLASAQQQPAPTAKKHELPKDEAIKVFAAYGDLAASNANAADAKTKLISANLEAQQKQAQYGAVVDQVKHMNKCADISREGNTIFCIEAKAPADTPAAPKK